MPQEGFYVPVLISNYLPKPLLPYMAGIFGRSKDKNIGYAYAKNVVIKGDTI
jgi:hypothetical protein